MLPAKRNKVDISKLTPQEQQLFAKYGKLPTHKNMLMKMQKERKYFDSGDYALSKAGVAPQSNVGTAIPNPENIPHASANGHSAPSVSPTTSTSPVNRESSLSHINTRSSELEDEEEKADSDAGKAEEPEPMSIDDSSSSQSEVKPLAIPPTGTPQVTTDKTSEIDEIKMSV